MSSVRVVMVRVYFWNPARVCRGPEAELARVHHTSAWAWPCCMGLWIKGEVGLVELRHNCRDQIPMGRTVAHSCPESWPIRLLLVWNTNCLHRS
jgi:hypothetical protein